eukprot:3123987-Pleurochrysis_carterae.AAC.1
MTPLQIDSPWIDFRQIASSRAAFCVLLDSHYLTLESSVDERWFKRSVLSPISACKCACQLALRVLV